MKTMQVGQEMAKKNKTTAGKKLTQTSNTMGQSFYLLLIINKRHGYNNNKLKLFTNSNRRGLKDDPEREKNWDWGASARVWLVFLFRLWQRDSYGYKLQKKKRKKQQKNLQKKRSSFASVSIHSSCRLPCNFIVSRSVCSACSICLLCLSATLCLSACLCLALSLSSFACPSAVPTICPAALAKSVAKSKSKTQNQKPKQVQSRAPRKISRY